MIRLACLLGLIALAMLIRLAVQVDGASAIGFSFVGMPALAIALVLYAWVRWRAGALWADGARHDRAGTGKGG
jgi:hypothetical protein